MSTWIVFLILLRIFVAASTLESRWSNDGFVATSNEQFTLNGGSFYFYGTNAYYASTLSDADLDTTFQSIAQSNLTVVRTWAFNDVPAKPSSGVYFQIIQNGTTTINDGADGLQRLDKVVATAEKYGLKLILTLTNNWSPPHNDNNGLPRGFASNDFGGIDSYVDAFCDNPTHDLFYTKPDIISAFKNYVSHIVTRYADNSTILGWELANDPRCSSTLPASPACNTTTITSWVANIADYIKTLDTVHLVTAGDGGFYCSSCPKLYSGSSNFKRFFEPTGPAFDGSFGVDTEDIISIPSIDFGSFQFFPDQVQYFPDSPAIALIAATGAANAWVSDHALTASSFGKPEALLAFSVVTSANCADFILFNSTTRVPGGPPGCGSISSSDQDYIYTSLATGGYNSKVGGILEFQFFQPGLTGPPTSRRRQATHTTPNEGNPHYGDITTNNANLYGSLN